MDLKRALGALLILAILLAACGGGQDDDSPQAPSAATPDPAVPYELLRLNMDDARALAYRPDGTQIAIADGATIWLYSADLEPIRALTGHQDAVRGLAWSPDGTRLASASLDQTARVWNPDTGGALTVIKGHTNWVLSVAWSPDGTQLATGSTDHSVRLWDAATGAPQRILGATQVEGFTFTLEGSTIPKLITELETAERTVSQLEGATGADADQLAAARSTVSRINGRDDAALIAAMRKLKADRFVLTVQIADESYSDELSALDNTAIRRLIEGMDTAAFMAQVTGGQFALSAELEAADITAILDAMGTPGLTWAIVREAHAHTDSVTAVAWPPDGATLASASADSTIRLWDVAAYTLIGTLDAHSDSLIALARSPDGTRLASAGWDDTIKVWDASAGINAIEESLTLEGHTLRVTALVWSPDGTMLATGSRDHTIRLWDATTGAELAALDAHGAELRALVWSPDGTRLISSAMDKTVRLWDVAALLSTKD
jgi:WD40 repeat protein